MKYRRLGYLPFPINVSLCALFSPACGLFFAPEVDLVACGDGVDISFSKLLERSTVEGTEWRQALPARIKLAEKMENVS